MRAASLDRAQGRAHAWPDRRLDTAGLPVALGYSPLLARNA